MKKQLHNRFKELKRIAPDAARKDAFRSVLQETMNAYPALAGSVKPFSLRGAFFSMHKPALAFLLIALLLMGSGGATFAAQSALPGDALYPIKLATEKVRVAIAASPTEKARLHLEFASRRLQELQRISDSGTIQNTNITAAVSNYKTQLDESQTLLAQNPQATAPIATLIDRATTENQQVIKALSEKADHKAYAAAFRSYLEDADDHAESKNEDANLALLNASSTQSTVATSTEPAIVHPEFKEKSYQKIESVKAKIQEMEQAVRQSQEQGIANPVASQKIEQAKSDLESAETKLQNGSYEDSFITSVQARRNAQDARRIFEQDKEQEGRRQGFFRENQLFESATSSAPGLQNGRQQNWYDGIFRRGRDRQEQENDN